MIVTLGTLMVWALVISAVERLGGPYSRRFGDLPRRSQVQFGAVFIVGSLVSGTCLSLLLAEDRTRSGIGAAVLCALTLALWTIMALDVRRVLRERRA